MRKSLMVILAADVVGYSSLMEADSEGTIASIERLRLDVLEPTIAAKRGQIVKSMGDGWLATFPTVSGAVESALQIQDRLNAADHITIRIGVHLGDITESESDIFGEGINIAARLQDCVDPGAVAISGTVHDLLDATFRSSFDDAGSRNLKNISTPVRIWSRGGDVSATALSFTDFGLPTLAITPFKTTDERSEVKEIAAALTGDLVTYLDSVGWLAAKVSSGESNATYSLQTRLRTQGDRLRLEARLSGAEGREVLVAKINGSLENAFDWQDESGTQLATEILSGVVADQSAIVEAVATDQRSAEQWVMLAFAGSGANASYYRYALDCLSEAMAINPLWPYPYARALAVLTTSINMGYRDAYEPYIEKRGEWEEALDRLEPPQAPSRILLALSRLANKGSASAVQAEIRSLLSRQPFDPELRFFSAWLYMYLGEPERGIELITGTEVGLSLELYSAPAKGALGIGYLMQGKDEEALAASREAARLDPNYLSAYRFQAAALAHMGRMEEARVALQKLPEGESIQSIRTRAGYVDNDATRRMFDGLRLAGLAEE